MRSPQALCFLGPFSSCHPAHHVAWIFSQWLELPKWATGAERDMQSKSQKFLKYLNPKNFTWESLRNSHQYLLDRDRNRLIVIVRCLNHLEPPTSLAFWFGKSTAVDDTWPPIRRETEHVPS